jgi:hypothetical protein
MTVDEAARILGVSRDVTRGELAAAYRRSAKATHPDRRENLSAREVREAGMDFVRATEARDVLSARLDGLADGDRSAGSTPPPVPRPMTFEEFVAWRRDAAWGPTPQWDPRADPVAPPPGWWAGEAVGPAAASRALGLLRRVRTCLRRLRRGRASRR